MGGVEGASGTYVGTAPPRRSGASERGFTMIEVIAVITLITILSGIAVYSLTRSNSNGKLSACDSYARSFLSALTSYNSDLGTYPPAGNGIQLTQTLTIGAAPYTHTYPAPLEALPPTNDFTIWTDGNGGVFVYPASQKSVPSVPMNAALDFVAIGTCPSSSVS